MVDCATLWAAFIKTLIIDQENYIELTYSSDSELWLKLKLLVSDVKSFDVTVNFIFVSAMKTS